MFICHLQSACPPLDVFLQMPRGFVREGVVCDEHSILTTRKIGHGKALEALWVGFHVAVYEHADVPHLVGVA